MSNVMLKYNIISWDTGLNDKKLINKMSQWIISTEKGSIPSGYLSEGYGFRVDETLSDKSTNN